MHPSDRTAVLRLTTLVVVLGGEAVVAGHLAFGVDEDRTRTALVVAQIAAAAFLLLAGASELLLRTAGAGLLTVVGATWCLAAALRLGDVLGVGPDVSGPWAARARLVALAAALAGVVRRLLARSPDRARQLTDLATVAAAVGALVSSAYGGLGTDGPAGGAGDVTLVAAAVGVVLLAASVVAAVGEAGAGGVLAAVGAAALGLVPLAGVRDGGDPTLLAEVGAFAGLAAFGLGWLWTGAERHRPRSAGAGALVAVSVAAAVVTVLVRARDGDVDGVTAALVGIIALTLCLPRVLGASERDRTAREVVSLRDHLRASEERFRVGFQQAPVGMLLTTQDGLVVEANAALARMLGAGAGSLEGRSLLDVLDPADRPAAGQLLAWARRGQLETSHVELGLVALDGRRVEGSAMVGLVDDGDRRFVLVLVEDRSAQRALSERLAFAERHDELTGLLRRAGFVEELHATLAVPPSGERPAWVLAVDVDGFKEVNDGLGHAIGDLVLRTVGDRLRTVLRSTDVLARLGGDEFAVLVPQATEDDVRQLAERLGRAVSAPVPMTGGGDLYLTTSVGVAAVAAGATQAEDVLRDATAALHEAKAAGRARVAFHHAELGADASKRVRIGSELHRAIEREELVALYQPIVDLRSGRLKGFEALVRWNHPERGLVGPGEFIDLAEETGLIVPIGGLVLRQALRRLAEWKRAGPSDERARLTMSVNLSARQLADPGLVPLVAATLAEARVPAGDVVLELTESAIMADPVAARAAMVALRELGVGLAVDDFGTGYSSLSYLQQFPVGILKVDRAFVRGLGAVAGDTAIVEAVVRLGHSLGLAVVAEGVETAMQHRHLVELGCDYGQGYLFGRPMAVVDIEDAFARGVVFGPVWALGGAVS